jgi:hypothetical protein
VLIEADQTLDVALERLLGRHLEWAPVVERGRLMGRLYVQDIMQTYRGALDQTARPTTGLPGRMTLLEARVSATSRLAGQTLQTAGFPPGTLVVSILRDGETIFPRATSHVEAGDVIMFMADPTSVQHLNEFLSPS